MRWSVSIFIAVLCALRPAIAQPPAYDIMQIYARFFVSSRVATQCRTFDKDTLTPFGANFMHVMTLAFQRYEEANTDASQEQMKAYFESRNLEMTRNADAMVAQKGCEDKDVQEIVRLFEAHAKMNLLSAPKP